MALLNERCTLAVGLARARVLVRQHRETEDFLAIRDDG